jgi:hypothetical protein
MAGRHFRVRSLRAASLERPLEKDAFGWNRHREERSDVAIQEIVGRPAFPWMASP